MHFHYIDWLIVVLPLLVVTWIGWRARRYVQGISDFLAGGRVAGRYVVAVAAGEAGLGLISVIAVFELYYRSGFAIKFWSGFAMPIGLLITLTGFAIYRYRETRALTLAQFLEVRYSKRLRVFAGLLTWTSGVINYALFPAVGARFIIYYCGLPDTIECFGQVLPTFGLTMAIFLSVALMIVMLGGQLTTMVTDCVAGLFSYALYVVIVVAVLCIFSWNQMSEAMLTRPAGQSMLDPFDTGKLSDFNVFYILVAILGGIYNKLSWQGAQAYHVSAVSPHEQKMGQVLGIWRAGYGTLMIVILAVAAYTYMNHADFASQAAEVRTHLTERINLPTEQATEAVRNQMLVPIAIRHFLPIGVTGAFCALMVFLMISTDTTYLHSWGSILVQDVILPFRKRPFTPRQQIWLLRGSIAGVAVFAFFFSLYYNQVTYILMFMALTGAIWMGGAGAVILGGLYWRRGTTAGAWGASITGSTLAACGFLLSHFWREPVYPWLRANAPGILAAIKSNLESLGDYLPIVQWTVTGERFPLSGQEIFFVTMVCSAGMYIGVSLLTCRESFNMDRMLHRGKYACDLPPGSRPPAKPPRSWKSLLGIDAQFTVGDKVLSISVFTYSMLILLLFLGVAGWNVFIYRWSKEAWAQYFWIMNIGWPLVLGCFTSVWFTIGGVRDLRRMFQRLATLQRSVLDDGRVIGHANADDLGTQAAADATEADGSERRAEDSGTASPAKAGDTVR